MKIPGWQKCVRFQAIAHILRTNESRAESRAEYRQDRNLADVALRFIQKCIRTRRVLWTYHLNMRLKGRSIQRDAILDAVRSYEMVKADPEDKYLPSYLGLSHTAGEAFHGLLGADLERGNVMVVTACRAREVEWEADWKTRRA